MVSGREGTLEEASEGEEEGRHLGYGRVGVQMPCVRMSSSRSVWIYAYSCGGKVFPLRLQVRSSFALAESHVGWIASCMSCDAPRTCHCRTITPGGHCRYKCHRLDGGVIGSIARC